MIKAQSKILVFALAAILTVPAIGQKKPLTHDVYDSWKAIGGITLSNNGQWLSYTISPQEGNNFVEVKSTDGTKTFKYDNVAANRFTDDNKFFIATLTPSREENKEATDKKVPADKRPKNKLLILNLQTGQANIMERITSFSMATEATDWILYRPEPPVKEEEKKEDKPPLTDSQEKEPTKQEENKEEKKMTGHGSGNEVVLHQLSTGKEIKLANVGLQQWNKAGTKFFYQSTPETLTGHGLFVLDLKTEKTTPLVEGLAQYRTMSLNEDESRIAFLSDIDDYRSKNPNHSIHVVSTDGKGLQKIAQSGNGIPDGWQIPRGSSVRWSENEQRLLFTTAPIPPTEEEKKPDPETTPDLDVWSYTDIELQPQQALGAARRRSLTYDAFFEFKSKKITQIESPEMENVTLPSTGEGKWGLYSVEKFTGAGVAPEDFYKVNLETGEKTLLGANVLGGFSFSPTGRWINSFDFITKESRVIDPNTGTSFSLTDRIPYPIHDIVEDVPIGGGPWGTAGYGKDDKTVFIYDQFDIWMVDLTTNSKGVNVTKGYGRMFNNVLRYNSLDTDAEYIDPSKETYLTAFNPKTKEGGFAWGTLDGTKTPDVFLMEPAIYRGLAKARDAEVYRFQRETVSDYREVYITTSPKLDNAKVFSETNPQQKDYIFPTVQLVEWTSLDGDKLQGKLYKPENVDPLKDYPMVTYFYDRESDTLHQYQTPAPSASTVNIAWFVSNGYFVFVPDIVYRTGYPGESAMSCIVSGVNHVVENHNVDPKRIGIQGQSWGGYQTAYLITETKMFAAAGAGAPVSNMFSAYGGIRYGSGLVRQLQYEQGQSRIGGTMWEYPMRYWENSPIFFADKVETPLLIMHNDQDGAVPYTQGIEYFTALWRLNKPCWLLVYNQEDHNLIKRKNRKDLSVRLGQFFDHYLKGEPMPEWMSKGIPAEQKGKNLGYKKPGEEEKKTEEKKSGGLQNPAILP